MILKCNSCEKKFVVPDQAITAEGRIVQCGSCGNKWKQFPVENVVKKNVSINKISTKKTSNLSKALKPKKKKIKKDREVNLYSPEYLEKKHGIKLNNIQTESYNRSYKKISFGFYNSLILFTVLVITLSRGLYFFQDIIIQNIPFTEPYINHFFESIKNIFEIWKNLILDY
jgi:predicted Zn finger-like uncharacterized protein